MSIGLQQTIIDYLVSKGWYFDWEHVIDVWGEPAAASEQAEFMRRYPGWTVPQWGEYWMAPYSDDPNHANYGKPKTRRYEPLQEALWSQVMREERPDEFEVFFQTKEAK